MTLKPSITLLVVATLAFVASLAQTATGQIATNEIVSYSGAIHIPIPAGGFGSSFRFTNSLDGSLWFTAPTGSTRAVITDVSGLASNQVVQMFATRRNDGLTFTGTNIVYFTNNPSLVTNRLAYVGQCQSNSVPQNTKMTWRVVWY